MAVKEAEWIQASGAAASGSDQEELELDAEDWHCLACDKNFKSEKALVNHERYL
jgi:Zinc-finger double-stranded RNA-binding